MAHDAPHSQDDARVLGALALELAPTGGAGRPALAQADAGALADRIGEDLAGFHEDAARCDLTTVGAHYDPVELLRPGWPVHDALDQLAARAPRQAGAGRLLAFGMHDGRLPGTLAPSPAFAGGPLRLVPFVLSGEGPRVARVGDAFERDLLERGMAGAATALLAQDLFGLRVEHARYLTLHDLVAMMAMQYDHAGLGPLWPVIESALLSPRADARIDVSHEPLLHLSGGEAHIALMPPHAWRARHDGGTGPVEDDAARARLDRAWQRFEARQRQFAAVLEAHGIPVTFDYCESAGELPWAPNVRSSSA
ncbi:hypothetical protein GCM10028862_22560 [Luteimonas pelagia]